MCIILEASRSNPEETPFHNFAANTLTDPIQGLVLDIEIDTKQTIPIGYFRIQKLGNFLHIIRLDPQRKGCELVGRRVAVPG